MQNATYLFEQPSRIFKNSESRWTAMAQMCLLYLSRNNSEQLPVYKSDTDGYLSKEGSLLISGFEFTNTVCEQKLKGEIFEIDSFENKFNHICPDILRVDKKEKQVTIIEIKTLSESVQRNLNLYSDLKKYLSSKPNWKCDLFYLLSHGHEQRNDWPALARINANIILWEDLFSLMKDTPIAYLLGDKLQEYCDPPAQRG